MENYVMEMENPFEDPKRKKVLSNTNPETGGPTEELIRIFIMAFNLASANRKELSLENRKYYAKEVAKILPAIHTKWNKFTLEELESAIQTQFYFALETDIQKNKRNGAPNKLGMDVMFSYTNAWRAYKLAKKRLS